MNYVLHSVNLAHTLDDKLVVQVIVVDNKFVAKSISVSAPEPMDVSTFLGLLEELMEKIITNTTRRVSNES